ncbi:MAG: GTPase Era [Rhodospirillales bacterium]|nr:GTPase Era [Rhodospirillales bacterium]
MSETGNRCGFIAVLGAPNVGKSTLINWVVGTKVSIVSPKVQTTRTRVLGIHLQGAAQIVFIDTPGIFEPRRRLDRAMVAAAWGGADGADIILLLVDAERGIDRNTRGIVEKLRASRRKAILAVNKVDLVKKSDLLKLASDLNATELFTDTFMISAIDGDGVDDLVETLASQVPQGPWMFPEDQISDMPQRLLAAEITREQLYHQLHQELPYSTTVETESWEQRDDGSVHINQVIFVQRESQRAIILGRKGQRIRSLGAAARAELKDILDCKVHLFLFVKVRESWGDDPERYRDWGLDFNA